jgi:hypothetical protein
MMHALAAGSMHDARECRESLIRPWLNIDNGGNARRKCASLWVKRNLGQRHHALPHEYAHLLVSKTLLYRSRSLIL